jgi:catechol 2,3-dioxygenase-like lactoylglutathione lyase family enzyme
MQLNTARVFVKDMEAAKAFYENTMGLPLKGDGSDHGYCVFQAGVADLVVERVAWGGVLATLQDCDGIELQVVQSPAA